MSSLGDQLYVLNVCFSGDESDICIEQKFVEVKKKCILVVTDTCSEQKSFHSQVCYILEIKQDKFPKEDSLTFSMKSSKAMDTKNLEIEIQRMIENDSGSYDLYELINSVHVYLIDNTCPTEVCSICREKIELKDVKQWGCYHYFHKECIDKWEKGDCPLCKKVYCKKKFEEKREAQMNYDIIDPMLHYKYKYIIRVKNSGITNVAHSGIFISYFSKYKPLKAMPSEEDKCWYVYFELKSQAEGVIQEFNGKQIAHAPIFPNMVITMVEDDDLVRRCISTPNAM